MAKKKTREFVKSEQFQLTSLIDCVFLLLVSFMTTTVFKNPAALTMKMPMAVNSALIEEHKLITEIDADGKIALNGKRVYLDDYDLWLAREKVAKGANSLSILADMNAKHGLVLEVMKRAKMVGIERIIMATDEPLETQK